MLDNLDNLPISILVRDVNGRRTTISWPTQTILIADLSREDQDCIGPEDEILLVTLGNCILYSQLANPDGITVEDIVGFFA